MARLSPLPSSEALRRANQATIALLFLLLRYIRLHRGLPPYFNMWPTPHPPSPSGKSTRARACVRTQ